jgi:hypothetical protein
MVFLSVYLHLYLNKKKKILMDGMPPPSTSPQYPYTIKRKKETRFAEKIIP